MRKGIFAIVMLMLSMPLAAKEGFYLQGFYSLADAGDLGIGDQSVTSGTLTFTSTSDDEGNALGLAGGYLFGNGFGLEGGFANFSDIGVTSTITANNAVIEGNTLDGSLTVSQDIDGEMFYIAPVGYLDLNPVTLKAKVGAAYFDVDNNQTMSGSGTLNGSAVSINSSIGTISESGTSLIAGIGAEYAFTENVSALVEYMRIQDVGGGDLSETDIDTLNIGLIYYLD